MDSCRLNGSKCRTKRVESLVFMKSLYIPPDEYCKRCHREREPDETWTHYPLCPHCFSSWSRVPLRSRMIDGAKIRALKANVPCTITEADIQIPIYCPALGLPLMVNKGKPKDNSATLDRIIPSLGYVPGNIAVISHKANRIKNDGTAQDLRNIADWMDSVTVQSPTESEPVSASIL